LNFNEINAKKSFLKYLPFIIFFAIIFTWHFTLPRFGDELAFAKVYHNQNIFNYLYNDYEGWSSRLLIEFFLVPLAGLPRIIWNFFDSIVFLLIAVLIPKVIFNMEKIDAKKSFIYNSLSCIFVLIYIFTTTSALDSAGYIATTLNYTWPLFFGLLHFYLLKKYVFHENNTSTKQKIVIYAIMIFALIFAINQEMMLVLVSVAYLFIILYCLYNKVKIPNTVLFMLFIISLEVLNVYLCPGNHVRYYHEISMRFPTYYNLTLVNKIDLGITVLFYRIVLLYSLTSLVFFGILGTYVYSITKNKFSVIFSLLPLIIVVTLGLMNLIGYMPLIHFIEMGMTKYGLLHSNLKHILIISSIYAIIIFSVMYSLIKIYKHGDKKISFAIFCLLILGFTSQMMRGFSPTVWASEQRWEIYYYFCVTCASYILSVELFESRYDKINNWLLKRKLWKFMYNLFSSSNNNHDIKDD
jgi:hypothetical protein